MKENDIDQIIAGLNRNENMPDIILSNRNKYGLTAVEKDLISTYTPEKALIIYGTLAPGKPNHHKMEHIKGEWKTAVVKGGKLENKGWGAALGFNGFKHAGANEQTDIPAQVLFSDELSSNWAFLDAFEGDGYRHLFARYELPSGEAGVGYIYAINEGDY